MKPNYSFRIALTIALFALLFWKINLAEVLYTLSSINKIYLIISLSFVPVLYIIRTYRWDILLRTIGIHKSFIDLFIVMMIGAFYGLITPGKVGEVGRAYHLAERKSATISTILMEKIIDVTILIAISILTVIVFFNNYIVFKYSILAAAIGISVFTLFLMNAKLVFLLARPFGAKKEDVNSNTDNFRILLKDKGTMLKTTFLAIVYYIIAYIFAYFILLSLNMDPFAVIALPIIILMGNVPITISGLGLRESVSAACFVLMGMSGEAGISFSVLVFISMILLPGIFGYLMVFINAGKRNA